MRNGVTLTALVSLGLPLVVGSAPGEPARSPHGPPALSLDAPPGHDASLPMAFEPNRGQTDAEVAFLVRGQGYGLFLTPGEAVLALRRSTPPSDPGERLVGFRSHHPGSPSRPAPHVPAVVRMRLVGADPTADVVGLDPLKGVSHYLLGNDPAGWRTRIPQYARVERKGVYPGVDLAYHGRGGSLEYDFRVAPGADPSAIRIGFEGVTGLRLDGDGDLVLEVDRGVEVVQKAPQIYQEVGGRRRPLPGGYRIEGDCQVAFAVKGRDRSRPLVIDPVLAYSTYLGGSGPDGDDRARSIAVDAAGNAYVTGYTTATDFPTASPIQASNGGNDDAFVAKVDPGGALVYSTYLGGNGGDSGYAVAFDGAGSAYVTGATDSGDFPTASPLQPLNASFADAFVAKLSPAGSTLVYSTYLGGTGNDYGIGISVDTMDNAYVTGYSDSRDFPTVLALQGVNRGGFDAFVARLNAAGSALVYSTYLGGGRNDQGHGIAVDATRNAHVTGYTESTDFPTASPLQAASAGASDAFLAKLTPSGSALVYSTYLGGSGQEDGNSIAVDGAGNVYVAGATLSTDFPTSSPLQAANAGFSDAFLAKLSLAGSVLVYSTYVGGNNDDLAWGIAADAAGNAYVIGQTNSTDFPTVNPIQASKVNPFSGDAFLAKVDPAGSALVYSTYLGGSGNDPGASIAVDAAGDAYATGWTDSPDFPTTSPLQAARGSYADAFITKLDSAGAALLYSTYLGGSGHEDRGQGIVVDAAGSAYVTGYTESSDFPIQGALQAAKADTGGYDAFVAKLDPGGASFIYCTYLGGRRDDLGFGIAIDAGGSAYVTGATGSVDFPTVNPLQVANAGGYRDAYVAKLSPDGSAFAYSTYLGGSGADDATRIAVDSSGSAYLTGGTDSTDFPTANPVQPANGGALDAFVAKLSPTGSALVYSTYLGGSGDDRGTGLALDRADGAHVAGDTRSTDFPTANPLQSANRGSDDLFLARLDPAGSALVYSTYLGGSGRDRFPGLALDGIGDAYLAGYTESTDFPTASPFQPNLGGSFNNAFVAKLDPAGAALVFSTYLGGSGIDYATAVAVDAAGNAYVTGNAGSSNFPVVDAFQTVKAGIYDAFVAKLSPAGSTLLYSTYLGGNRESLGTDIAVDGTGGAYVTGYTNSFDFPTQGGIRSTGAGDLDAFVASFSGCLPYPGRVARLRGVKALPGDVRFSWDPASDAAGGYHLHAVGSRAIIPVATASSRPVCTAAAGRLDCTHGGGLPAPPAEFYYQVVAVCSDGLSEGPI